MPNIRVDLGYTIKDGTEVKFRSPADCSAVTGLIIHYPDSGIQVSKEFVFADAHGNNVGDIDHLFSEDAVVKVILDMTRNMAFVQNADTNSYIESTKMPRVLVPNIDYGSSAPVSAEEGKLFFVPEVDSIAEQGTTNGWTWRKWFSGLAEMWGKFPIEELNIKPLPFPIKNSVELPLAEVNYCKGEDDCTIYQIPYPITFYSTESPEPEYFNRLSTTTIISGITVEDDTVKIATNVNPDAIVRITGYWK